MYVNLKQRNEQVSQENLLYSITADDFRATLEFMSPKLARELFIITTVNRAAQLGVPARALVDTYNFDQPNCSAEQRERVIKDCEHLLRVFKERAYTAPAQTGTTLAQMPQKDVLQSFKTFYEKFDAGAITVSSKLSQDRVIDKTISAVEHAQEALSRAPFEDESISDRLLSKISTSYVLDLISTKVSDVSAKVKPMVQYLFNDEPNKLDSLVSFLRAGQFIANNEKSLSHEQQNNLMVGAVQEMLDSGYDVFDAEAFAAVKQSLPTTLYKPNAELQKIYLDGVAAIRKSYLVETIAPNRARYFEQENSEFILALREYAEHVESPQLKSLVQAAIISSFVKSKVRKSEPKLGEIYHVVKMATDNVPQIAEPATMFDLSVSNVRGADLDVQILASGKHAGEIELIGKAALKNTKAFSAIKGFTDFVVDTAAALKQSLFKPFTDELAVRRASINAQLRSFYSLVADHLGENKDSIIINDVLAMKKPGYNLFDSIKQVAAEKGVGAEQILFGFGSLAAVSSKVDVEINKVNELYSAYKSGNNVRVSEIGKEICNEIEAFVLDKQKGLKLAK
jgi:hypothetical protein